MNLHQTANEWAPRMLSVLRIVSGLVFWQHGVQKMLGFPQPRPAPEFLSQIWFAGMLELVLAPLLIVGFLTRPVAFILAGEMAVAYWVFHAPQGPFPMNNGGDASILFCFVFLFIAAAGPGRLALDHSRRRTARID